MSFQAMTWATEQYLPAMQKIVLLMLANRTNHETGLCIPKIKTLAAECGMSETACKNAIRALEAAGCLLIQQRFQDGLRRSNQYQLLMHARRETPTGRCETTPGGSLNAPGVGRQTPTEPGSINQEFNQGMSGKPDHVSDEDKNITAKVIGYLNGYTGHDYRVTPSVAKLVAARHRDGYSLEDFREVIERKCKEWKGTKMEQYLRPKTLFNATNFESYAGQRGMELREGTLKAVQDGKWWWESAAEIEQLAQQLNVASIVREPFWKFKCRVAKASKDRRAMDAILADMMRTGNAAFEETARYFGVATPPEGLK